MSDFFDDNGEATDVAGAKPVIDTEIAGMPSFGANGADIVSQETQQHTFYDVLERIRPKIKEELGPDFCYEQESFDGKISTKRDRYDITCLLYTSPSPRD